jgi:ribosomal-protein-alanine N-acetyltransferase
VSGAGERPADRVTPRLETERLILRAPTLGDAADVFELHRHKSVADGVLSIPHPCPEDHGETWVRWVTGDAPSAVVVVWVIEERDTGRVVGDCGAQIDAKQRVAGIGYILHPARQGLGLMGEALHAMLAWLLGRHEPPVERVYADVFPENGRSHRLCERLGMTREGVMRGSIRKNEVQRDAVRWAILRDEFTPGR